MSWAEIKKAINSNISKTLDVLITEKCNELQSKLNSVYNTVTVTGNIPSVKSVQRGLSQQYDEYMTTYETMSGWHAFYIDITINAVNTSKSIVNVSSIGVNNNNYACILLNSTTIRVYFSFQSNAGTRAPLCPFTWQVIEFY